jgi:hypothetical protein
VKLDIPIWILGSVLTALILAAKVAVCFADHLPAQLLTASDISQ